MKIIYVFLKLMINLKIYITLSINKICEYELIHIDIGRYKIFLSFGHNLQVHVLKWTKIKLWP